MSTTENGISSGGGDAPESPAQATGRAVPVTDEVAAQASQAPDSSDPRVAQFTLRDRSCFRGQVTDAGVPNGFGVIYTAQGTHTYAGTVVPPLDEEERVDRRLGVQLWPNGTLFAGDFTGDDAHGDGVKRDPFGSQFLGQWHEGELDGQGLSIDVDGEACWGQFKLNEYEDDGTNSWTSTTQEIVLRALLAEQSAMQAQETAREVEVDVLLQGLSAVGNEPFNTADEVEQFTQEEETKLKAFLEETQQQLHTVEQDANRWKFQEAQLKEKQKNLRREITEARATLAYKAKFVALAETRSAQLADAERTLQSLQLQVQNLEQHEHARTEAPDPRGA